jgi:hypothetical protein
MLKVASRDLTLADGVGGPQFQGEEYVAGSVSVTDRCDHRRCQQQKESSKSGWRSKAPTAMRKPKQHLFKG